MSPARNKKMIAVVTGTRADFGLLHPVITAINNHPELNAQIIVTGVHLTTGTWKQVDKLTGIAAKVRMQKNNCIGRDEDVQALGRGIANLGKTFVELKPHVVLVLGDRIEALAAACAAQVGGYHLAHIHGGDRAEGVADESMRHAITKLAHIHFPATATSKRRILKMGEQPASVFQVGSPAIDNLVNVTANPDSPDLIVMQHPIGRPDATERKHMAATLAATANYSRIIMSPNNDPGSKGILGAIRAKKVEILNHLPREQFLELLAGAKAIIGNSSAGLIEAAALKTACVNIGPRQAGREKPENVVSCEYGKDSVAGAIKSAIKLDLRRLRHPYGQGNTGQNIADTLAKINLKQISLRKRNVY